jgi:hypothetical protein
MQMEDVVGIERRSFLDYISLFSYDILYFFSLPQVIARERERERCIGNGEKLSDRDGEK